VNVEVDVPHPATDTLYETTLVPVATAVATPVELFIEITPVVAELQEPSAVPLVLSVCVFPGHTGLVALIVPAETGALTVRTPLTLVVPFQKPPLNPP
jgi:hypothetical protein